MKNIYQTACKIIFLGEYVHLEQSFFNQYLQFYHSFLLSIVINGGIIDSLPIRPSLISRILKAFKPDLCARHLLVRCSILQRPRDESWFTGESNGEGNQVRGLQKLTGTPSPTPINSISRYFAASRRAMNIAPFLPFSPRAFVIFLSSARFF